jgi:hypothetical protein
LGLGRGGKHPDNGYTENAFDYFWGVHELIFVGNVGDYCNKNSARNLSILFDEEY